MVLWVLPVIVLAGALVALFLLRGRPARHLGIFQALLASLALLTSLAALVCFVALAVLGFPSLPQPISMTINQVGGIVQLGIGSAAAVGVTVALLVAYRKQRDAESLRDAAKFADAAAKLGDLNYLVRHSGVLALRDLADNSELWRQRCIDMLSVALVRVDDRDEHLRREICAVIRSRLGDGGEWSGSRLTVANGRLIEVDLSSLRFRGGLLQIENLTVSQSLDLSNLKLEAGARLTVRGLRIRGSLKLDGLHVTSRCNASLSKVCMLKGARFHADLITVEANAVVDFGNVVLKPSSAWSMSDLRAHGRLGVWNLSGTDAEIKVENVLCRRGRMRFKQLHLVGGALSISGSVERQGYLSLDSGFFHGTKMGLYAVEVVERSALVMTNMFVGGDGVLDLHKVYNKSGSLLYADISADDGLLNVDYVQNEVEKRAPMPVLILRLRSASPSARLHVSGGGNYGGRTFLELNGPVARSAMAGAVAIKDTYTSEGELFVRLDPRVSVTSVEGNSISDVLVGVKATEEQLRQLCGGTSRDSIRDSLDATRPHWEEDLASVVRR